MNQFSKLREKNVTEETLMFKIVFEIHLRHGEQRGHQHHHTVKIMIDTMDPCHSSRRWPHPVWQQHQGVAPAHMTKHGSVTSIGREHDLEILSVGADRAQAILSCFVFCGIHMDLSFQSTSFQQRQGRSHSIVICENKN